MGYRNRYCQTIEGYSNVSNAFSLSSFNNCFGQWNFYSRSIHCTKVQCKCKTSLAWISCKQSIEGFEYISIYEIKSCFGSNNRYQLGNIIYAWSRSYRCSNAPAATAAVVTVCYERIRTDVSKSKGLSSRLSRFDLSVYIFKCLCNVVSSNSQVVHSLAHCQFTNTSLVLKHFVNSILNQCCTGCRIVVNFDQLINRFASQQSTKLGFYAVSSKEEIKNVVEAKSFYLGFGCNALEQLNIVNIVTNFSESIEIIGIAIYAVNSAGYALEQFQGSRLILSA
ncbi:hypothetical protein D3C75_703740 [compost metagenome]